jgi:excisionase family DNA binding protein
VKKVNEVAEVLRLNKYTIYRYIREGKLRAVKLNRAFRIPDEELERIKTQGTQNFKGRK